MQRSSYVYTVPHIGSKVPTEASLKKSYTGTRTAVNARSRNE